MKTLHDDRPAIEKAADAQDLSEPRDWRKNSLAEMSRIDLAAALREAQACNLIIAYAALDGTYPLREMREDAERVGYRQRAQTMCLLLILYNNTEHLKC